MYQHTQRASLLLVVIAAIAIMMFLVADRGGPALVFPAIVIGTIAFAFHSLTTDVGPQGIRFWFGPGWVHKSFTYGEITSTRIVSIPWYRGWGIRWISRGWLYNVGPGKAVELELRSGRRVWIGSDEPEELHRAIVAFSGKADKQSRG